MNCVKSKYDTMTSLKSLSRIILSMCTSLSIYNYVANSTTLQITQRCFGMHFHHKALSASLTHGFPTA